MDNLTARVYIITSLLTVVGFVDPHGYKMLV